MGLPTYLPTPFLLLPSWGVLTSRSYREWGVRTPSPLSTGPATAAEPGSAKRRAHRHLPAAGRTA